MTAYYVPFQEESPWAISLCLLAKSRTMYFLGQLRNELETEFLMRQVGHLLFYFFKDTLQRLGTQ